MLSQAMFKQQQSPKIAITVNSVVRKNKSNSYIVKFMLDFIMNSKKQKNRNYEKKSFKYNIHISYIKYNYFIM
jgi:preprotein translocase subunit SecB